MNATSVLEEDFLRGIDFFTGLPDEDLEVFARSSYIRHYRKNEHIYHQGDETDRFFAVMGGWIKLYRETIDGEEAVPALLTAGDISGEAALLYGNKTCVFSAQAIEKSCILEIRRSVLEERANANPEILRRIIISVSKKMERLQTENEHMFHMNTAQRVACLLLRLSSHMIGKGGTFTIPYDKSIAAAQLGMKRETFSRALMRLRAFGVTVKGSEISIDNFVKLSEYCCLHCSLSAGECAGARCMTCPSSSGGKGCAASGLLPHAGAVYGAYRG